METQRFNLLEFVRALVERLMLNAEFNRGEVERLVVAIQEDLERIRADYTEPAPEGAETVQELMLEAVDLYGKSLQEILIFLDDNDEDHLSRSVFAAEEASDVLLAMEDVIQANKHVLSEMVQA